MPYFLPSNSYTFGFKFRQLYPNKQPWISLGLAGKPHLGDDLICNGIQGIATMRGVGKYVWGESGGHQLHFYPEGTTDLIRFLHLKSKETTKTGLINIGDKVFITGNSGSATNTPHLHADIWDLKNGPININNINGFKNPATYVWEQSMFPIKLSLKILANKISWPTLPAKVAQLVSEMVAGSSRRLYLDVQVEHTGFENIPFEVYESVQYKNYDVGPNGEPIWNGTYTIVDRLGFKKTWMDEYVAKPNNGYDMVMLLVDEAQWPGGDARGFRTDSEQGPVELQVCANENDTENVATGVMGNAFINRSLHEIGHGLFMITFQEDLTHYHAYTTKNFNLIFDAINYQTLKAMLNEHHNEREPMLIIHKKSDVNTKFALSSDAKIGFADFPAYQKFTAGRTVIDVELEDAEFDKIPTSLAVIKT